jgi:tetratricopeptide (TPR) repeat protein
VVLRRRIGQGSASAQEVAGLVAAFGREVTLDLLSEASDADADTVAQAVDELWQDRILREVGAGYDFSHDLLRVAAYAEVSPARRWLLHRRLAQALELSTAQGGEPVPGQLAEQYERGGRPDRALPAYEQAAEIAACRFAFAEAVRLHRCALRMVEALPAGSRRDRHELDCLLAMAAPLNALEGYASSELQAVLERAVEVARVIGSDAMVVTGLIGLWASMFVRGAIRDAYQTLAPALFRPGLNEQLLGEAYFALGGSASSLGRHQEALVHFERAHQRVEGSESLAVGTRPEVHALAWAAHTHWLVGQNEVAAERAAEAVGRARSFDHPYSLAVALAYACITHHMREDRVALRAAVEELDRLCRRHGFAYYREWALILGGWLEGGERGVARIREGIANLRRERSLARMPYWLWLLADTLEGTGQTGAVQATLDAARVSAEATGDAWWLPEILRTQARLAGDDALLGQAADLARSQGSVALLARCEADRVAPP